MRIKRLFASLLPIQKVVVGFAAVILLGGILLSLPVSVQGGKSIGFLNAMFTSTSSVCVTGLVVTDTGSTFSLFGQIIILLLIQTGGLGFMTIATLIFMALRKRINLRERMVIAESMAADSLSGLVRLVKTAAKVAFTIEGVGAVLLMFRFIPQYGMAGGIFKSIFHAVSAFCNAGFDNLGNNYASLMAYVTDPLVSGTVMGLIILGGLGFALIQELVTRKPKQRISLHTKVVVGTSLALIIVGVLAFSLLEWNNPATMGELSVPGKLLAGAFQSVTPRTAGFNTIDQASMTNGSKLLSVMFMFIGASPASTGGGIKTTTFFLLMAITYSIVRGRKEANIGHFRISQETRRKVGAITTLALGLVIVATFAICVLEPHLSIDAILYDAVSAFGTVGLSYGITNQLMPVSKIILMVLMFSGRVGPLTLSMAITNKRREQEAESIRYPEGQIIVG